jgi:hypothetical protein
MADRSSLDSHGFFQTALVITKSACDLSLAPLPDESARASLGWPGRKRPFCIPFGLSLLTALLAAVLIPFHRDEISDPKLLLQGCQFPSRLQEADGIRIAQHRRADGRLRESSSLAQSLKQEGETLLDQRMPPLREQEPIPCLWHRRLPGRRETGLIQIGVHRALSVGRQGKGAGMSTFSAHRHRSAGAVHIREAYTTQLANLESGVQQKPEDGPVARRHACIVPSLLAYELTGAQQASKRLWLHRLGQAPLGFGYGVFREERFCYIPLPNQPVAEGTRRTRVRRMPQPY